ncbi:MAG: hypothetical protein WKG07_48650 [Hymenobacter sp.]
MDALYAFTDCEISHLAQHLRHHRRQAALRGRGGRAAPEHRHNRAPAGARAGNPPGRSCGRGGTRASLEKIFIENRIYRKIEECETWEQILETIDAGLKKFVRVEGEKLKANDLRLVIAPPGERGRPHAPDRNPHQAHLEIRRLQGRGIHPEASTPSWLK